MASEGMALTTIYAFSHFFFHSRAVIMMREIVDRFEAPPGAQTIGFFTIKHYNPYWWPHKLEDSKGLEGIFFSDSTHGSLGRGNPDMLSTPYEHYDIWTQSNYTP